jgi:hypothetical protein
MTALRTESRAGWMRLPRVGSGPLHDIAASILR